MDQSIEFQVKNQELQNLLDLSRQKIDTSAKTSVQENIQFFEKKDKVFHAKQQ